MKPNFWLYSSPQERFSTARALISFGSDVFKRAKAIKELEILKEISQGLIERTIQPWNDTIHEFIFEHLIDCVRFLLFFENYMKAELIIRGYCVHTINRNYLGFKQLATQQYSRPIKIDEIHAIEKFHTDFENNIINHPALKDKTIGIRELISSDKYYCNYDFDESMVKIIFSFNTYRNKLHLHDSIEYDFSKDFISSLEKMNEFVDKKIRERSEGKDLVNKIS